MRLSRKGKYNLLNTNGNSVSNFIIGLQTKFFRCSLFSHTKLQYKVVCFIHCVYTFCSTFNFRVQNSFLLFVLLLCKTAYIMCKNMYFYGTCYYNHKKNIIFLQKNLVDKKKRRTFAHA